MKRRLLVLFTAFLLIYLTGTPLALTNSLSELPGLDPGSGQDYVTVDLESGELTLLVDPDELNVKDLSWVEFELVPFMDQTLLPLNGVFISGRIKNGILNGSVFV